MVSGGFLVVETGIDSTAACDTAGARWARLALRAGLLLGIAIVAGALLVLLGAHRADAETKAAAGGPASDAAGGSTGHHLHGDVRPTGSSVVTPTRKAPVPVTPPVSQTVTPVVQQVGGASSGVTTPSSPTLPPAIQQVAPRQLSLPPPLAGFVNSTPLAQRAFLPTTPVDTVGHVSPGGVVPLSPTGSDPSSLGWTNVAGGGPPSAFARSGSSHNGSGVPWSPGPLGTPVLPPAGPSGGGAHAPNDLLADLPASVLTLGLLALMILLLALWSTGRPAPKPEVSPA